VLVHTSFRLPKSSELTFTDNISDLWAAFLLRKSTLIPTNIWVNDESLERAAALDSSDDYCNLSTLIFARVVNCLSGDVHPDSGAEPVHECQELWFRLQQWWTLRPKRIRHLYHSKPTALNPFPLIIFSQTSSSKLSSTPADDLTELNYQSVPMCFFMLERCCSCCMVT
jgi:hypothetical protein